MKRRNPNPRIAKTHFTYDASEVAELYGCHRNTVRNWVKLGLKPIDGSRPALFHGTELNAFHAGRRAAAKRPCGPGTIYCAPCRSPKRPQPGSVEITPQSSRLWIVRGKCPACGRQMMQRLGSDRTALFRAAAAGANHAGYQPLGERGAASVNCASEGKELNQ